MHTPIGRRARRRGLPTLAFLVALGAGAVVPVAAGATPASAPAPAVPGGGTAPAEPGAATAADRVVVRFDPVAGAALAAADQAGGALGGYTAVVPVGPGGLARTLADLRARPGVAWAEPDWPVAAAEGPSDPRRGEQWYLDRVGAPEAWGRSHGDPSVVVAVLDTGVDTTHPDLAGKLVAGHDAVSGACGAGSALAHHGTAVAGLVGAATGNGVGVAGVGWDTSVMPVRVLCDDGSGRSADLAAAIRWAVDGGAAVVNMSLTGPSPSTIVAEAVAYAIGRGVVLTAAAGNNGTTAVTYPANYPGVIAVGATDTADRLAPFSSRGPWVDLAAPGTGILVLSPGGGYRLVDGTSFATPIASAAAALLRAEKGPLAPASVAALLTGSARPLATAGQVASGLLDIDAALSGAVGGFRLVTAAGDVTAYGGSVSVGSLAGAPLFRPIVGMAATPSGAGYWLVASDGGVFSFGDAPFLGSIGGTVLNQPVVGMAATPSGAGYWFVAADGGVFAYGDAGFHGSLGDTRLLGPIVGMAATPSGAGYWLVASDGGVFSFGDAPFLGSIGGTVLNQPVVGMAATPSGAGYWFVAADGGVFAYGDAGFHGSLGGQALAAPVVGLVSSTTGKGYWLATADGGVTAFGDAVASVGAALAGVVGISR